MLTMSIMISSQKLQQPCKAAQAEREWLVQDHLVSFMDQGTLKPGSHIETQILLKNFGAIINPVNCTFPSSNLYKRNEQGVLVKTLDLTLTGDTPFQIPTSYKMTTDEPLSHRQTYLTMCLWR